MKNSEQHTYANPNSVSTEPYYHDDEISLFEILSVIWKRKIFIILSVLSCIAIAGLYLMLNNGVNYKTYALLSLNFPGIEKYNNPDNSTFDKSQIISPSILSKVDFFNDTNKVSGVKSKRSMLGIEDVIPQTILSEMKKNPSKTYLTNRFSLSLTTDKETPISESDRSKILLSIIDEYKNDFLNKYVRGTNFAENIPDTFLKSNDYIDIVEILNTRIDNVVGLLIEKVQTTGNFRSSLNNISFADLQGEFEILKNVELARIMDIVENLNLTKDKNILIIKLKQKIKNLDAEAKKESGKAQIAQALLEKVTTVSTKGTANLNIPAGATLETTFIEKLRKEDNVSYLIKTILDTKSNANDLSIEKSRMTEIINDLEKRLVVKGDTDNVKFVESALNTLINNYNSLSERFNNLNRTYLNIKFANAIKIEQNPVSEIIRDKNAPLIIALTGIASLFICVFATFFIEYISNARLENKQLKEKESEPLRELNLNQEKTEESEKIDQKNNVA